MNWWLWALLAALFAGITAVLGKIGVEQINPNLATALRTTVVLVFTWGIALSTVSLQEIGGLSRRNWIFLTLSGVATGLSWLCYFRALQLGDVSRVAPVDKLSVVFVLLFSVLLLRERLLWTQWLGAGLILAGVMLVAWKPAD
jgi:bacterial/archaeal transporter family protein